MGVGMGTTNLFGHPAFKDGAFTSNDRKVRRAAIGKAMRGIDLAAELSAEVFVFWGGREGTEVGAAKDPRDALERYREAVNVLVDYSESNGYGLRFAIEPKPNEPRGDIFLPTVGHALHFISTLDHPDLVGLNPEVAHDTMAGLSFHHARRAGAVGGQALPHRPQRAADRPLRPGLPLRRRGPQGGLPARPAARARGLLRSPHFDAHAYRNENPEGVWDFAAGCMRTYTALAERAAAFDELPEVKEALAAAGARPRAAVGRRRQRRTRSRPRRTALDELAKRGYYNERLDQLVVEVLMGLHT